MAMTIFVPFLSMKSIYSILNKCLHYLLALQVLNLSFGNLAMEGHIFPHSEQENNQIDSALEFITETILGWDDFIPEKHKAQQDRHFIKASTCFLFCEKIIPQSEIIGHNRMSAHALFIPGSLSDHYREINPPPPKRNLIG
jgi:hypothetical protein